MKININLFSLLCIVIIIGVTAFMLNNINEKIIPLISAIMGALYATWLNNIWANKRSLKDRKNTILLASLDKRLTAHQEAYNYLRKLLGAAYMNWNDGARRTNLMPIISDAKDFWDKNILFLSEEASDSFQIFINFVAVYNQETVSLVEKEMANKRLMDAG